MPSNRIRILLADDHEAMLEHVARQLGADFDVVGKVRDGKAALEAVSSLHPDLLLLDISMPGLTGLETASELQRKHAKTKIVFLTIHEEPEYVRLCFASGASGYVIKPRLASDLLVAIREVLAGRSFISPPLLQDEERNP